MPIAEHSRKKLPDSISIIQILILTVKCQPFRLLSLISEQNAYAVRLKCIFYDNSDNDGDDDYTQTFIHRDKR